MTIYTKVVTAKVISYLDSGEPVENWRPIISWKQRKEESALQVHFHGKGSRTLYMPIQAFDLLFAKTEQAQDSIDLTPAIVEVQELLLGQDSSVVWGALESPPIKDFVMTDFCLKGKSRNLIHSLLELEDDPGYTRVRVHIAEEHGESGVADIVVQVPRRAIQHLRSKGMFNLTAAGVETIEADYHGHQGLFTPYDYEY